MELWKIIKYLDKKFPEKKISAWDKAGFQHLTNNYNIDFAKNIKKVVVCLDLNEAVSEFSLVNNIDLIITRHPFIFDSIELESKNLSKKRIIKQLKEKSILVYSIHTNYDQSVYQDLWEILKSNFLIKKIKKFGLENESNIINLKLDLTFKEFITKLRKTFNTNCISISKNLKMMDKISSFYLTTGSGFSTIQLNGGFKDIVFVTGEVKWNEWIYANDNNIKLISIGHYMEQYFVKDIAKKLINNFAENITVETFDINNQYFELGENNEI